MSSNLHVEQLQVLGSWVFTPKVHADSRGLFYEWFKKPIFEESTENVFDLVQANCSISKKGVIRGIHFAAPPLGQAKYVSCFSGSVLDVVVDLREESPTFGKWDSVELNSRVPRAVYIPPGCGHGFMSLEENTTFVYLCDQSYNPDNEFEINPFDLEIGIDWPTHIPHILSEKDKNAPSMRVVLESLNQKKI